VATACGSRSQLPRIRQQEFGRSTFQYDINRDAAGESPKVPLNDVARAVKEAAPSRE
jgi:hypothetical protein